MSEEQNKEVTADAAPVPVETPAAAPAAPATQAAAKVTRRRTPSVDKVAAEHQKVLAEALTKAAPVAAKKPAAKATKPAKVSKAAKPAAVAAEKPAKAKPAKAEKPVKPEKVAKAAKAEKPAKPVKEAKVAKAEKPPKLRKPKLVRDSYAMPEAEYALIAELKKRLAALGSEVKKSELLRGGIAVLAALNDAELKAVMGRVERIKTGRPAKK